ncbi:uncharacterized protein TNCV_1626601 [Trichonephila clavipes]|nr:uncharacterized protein TNCV_1626601 [Trichonephila clavipes]
MSMRHGGTLSSRRAASPLVKLVEGEERKRGDLYVRKYTRDFVGIQENGMWRSRSNLELYQSYKESDIVNFIKIQRTERAVHVVRMDENRTTKNVLNAQRIGRRRKERPNLKWIDGLKNIF